MTGPCLFRSVSGWARDTRVTSTCRKLPESCAAHTIVRLPEIHALGPFRTRIRQSIKYVRSIGYTLINRLRSIDRTSIRGRQARMTDEQIARPSLARFRLPCGSTAVRLVRGHASAVASLRPDVFVLVRRLRTRRPTANRTRAFRWTARRASGTSESAAGSDVRLRSAGSLRGGRRRT